MLFTIFRRVELLDVFLAKVVPFGNRNVKYRFPFIRKISTLRVVFFDSYLTFQLRDISCSKTLKFNP